MKPLAFTLGDTAWLQAAVELKPPSSVTRAWWRTLAGIASKATAIRGAHVTLRIEHVPDEPIRRHIGVVLPDSRGDELEEWQLVAMAELNGIYSGSIVEPEVGLAFWEEIPNHVCALPIHGYRAAGNPLACDFQLLSSLESLMIRARDSSWSYQLNAADLPLDTEEKRAARKNLARLQHAPAIPNRIVRQQQRVLDVAERSRWRVAEFVGAPDRFSMQSIQAIISQDFRESYGSEGFTALCWNEEEDESALDAWNSGVHPCALGELQIGPFVDNACIPAVWACPFSEDTDSPELGPPSDAPDVFLSYSTRDQSAAFTVCHLLEKAGISCWIAPRNIIPGREWAEAIVRGICQSHVTVLLLSGGSNLSRYVLRELEITVKEKHPIIPMSLEECNLSEAIQFFLTTHQRFDAMTPPIDLHVDRLVEVLRQLLPTKS